MFREHLIVSNSLIQLTYKRQLSARAFDNVNHNLLWIMSAVPKSNSISVPQGSIVSQYPDVRVQSHSHVRKVCNKDVILAHYYSAYS